MDRLVFGIIPITTFYCFGCLNFGGQFNLVLRDQFHRFFQLNDETGKLVERRVYDPWGRERDPNNWGNYLTDTGYRRTDRGYIGQEHLPQFGLINLNARLYDPILGRFLSPDPFVQSPLFSQNFNRYSYAMNNPLKYTDPSGDFPLIPLIFMILSNAYIQGEHTQMNGGKFWSGFAQGAVIGAATSGLTYGVGELFGHVTGSVGTELLRAGAHGLVGGGINAAQGGNFWQGFGTGAISSFAGSGMSWAGMPSGYLPFAMGAVGAGTSWALGGNPMSGFMQGFDIGALNHNGRGTIDDPVQLDGVTIIGHPAYTRTFGYALFGDLVSGKVDDGGLGPWTPSAAEIEVGVSASYNNMQISGGVGVTFNGSGGGFYFTGTYGPTAPGSVSISPYLTINVFDNYTPEPSSLNAYKGWGLNTAATVGPLSFNYGESSSYDLANPFTLGTKLYNSYGISFMRNAGWGLSRYSTYTKYFYTFNNPF